MIVISVGCHFWRIKPYENVYVPGGNGISLPGGNGWLLLLLFCIQGIGIGGGGAWIGGGGCIKDGINGWCCCIYKTNNFIS